MLLKYLSRFQKLLIIPLINCKVELKLKWEKYCVLAAAGFDNICLVLIMLMKILIILLLVSKTQTYMFLSALYQQIAIKSYQNFLAKDLKDQFIGMNIKQRVRVNI